MSTAPLTLSPFPAPRDLHVLAVGLIVGVLLGPAVLGRTAPQTYSQLFNGHDALTQLREHDHQTTAQLAALQATGVSDDALAEHTADRHAEAQQLRVAAEAIMDRRAWTLVLSVGLALFAVAALEAALGPMPTQRRSDPEPDESADDSDSDITPPADADRLVIPHHTARFITVRYALLAVAAALLLARPSLLFALPWLFIALLLTVALLAGLLPLGKSKSRE